jgi:hypothetical protein
MKKISEIADNLNHIHQDIKAEVVVADCMEKGLNPDDFVVMPSGTFKRRFSTDIHKAEILRLSHIQSLLSLYVNRDSIYDSLPEGFFHSTPEKPLRGSDEMSEESKKIRREEKESRAFFVPFENEIFLQHTALEIQEREMFKRFRESLFDEIYPEFWDFDRSLDSGLVSGMVLLLHFAYQVAGNPGKMALCLGTILNEHVVCKEIDVFNSTREKRNEHQLPLGAARLGMDFICGNSFDDLLPEIEFSIGPLKNSHIADYLESGRISEFLGCFYNYFVPAGMDVKTRIIVEQSQQHFVLGEGQYAPILGYNSGI